MKATISALSFIVLLAAGASGQQASRTEPVEGIRDNGTGIVGLAPEVRLMPLRVCTRLPSVGGNRCAVSAMVGVSS